MADLVTLQEYKDYKRINNPERDTLIQMLISSASGLIKTYCGRTFIDYFDVPKTEAINITSGMTGIVLKETPIIGNVLVSSDNVDISSDISVDSELGIVYYDVGMFTPGLGSVIVTYTGGYEDTPSDIKLATFELVDYYLNGEHTQKKTFGGATIENYQTGNEWPFHIRAILNMYRDV